MTASKKPPHMRMSISLSIFDTRGRRQKMTHEINAPMPTRIEFHLSVSFGEKANYMSYEQEEKKRREEKK